MKKIISFISIILNLSTIQPVFAQESYKLDKTDCLALLMTIETNKGHATRINPRNDATPDEKKYIEEQNLLADLKDQKIELTRTTAKQLYKKANCADYFKKMDALFEAEKKLVQEDLKKEK